MNADRPDPEAQIAHLEDEIAHLQHLVEHERDLNTANARERHALLETMGRYRAALARIADAESGHWGRIAHDALANDHKDGGREP